MEEEAVKSIRKETAKTQSTRSGRGSAAARRRSAGLVLAVLILMPSATGCAVHYYDAKTGTEHIWGFGHMKMRVTPPNEGLQTVVRGTDVIGASIGSAKGHAHRLIAVHIQA